ncbi:transcriptional regulator [Actinoplanes sp. ATCC 53533]|nr:transcriptional regulator [Actinoplanes sp. ATCC 53533]
MTDAAVRPQHLDMRTSICTMLADAYQIAGEVMFDLNRHGDAEHCYAIAASAAQQANAADLWACAMIRHSYVSVYGGQHADAVPMLRLALRLARNGNSALSTRHWAADVLAQALAATGDAKGCDQALELAEKVHGMPRPHNGGWLRFDGSRLPEDRASCYLSQQRPDLAEPLLTRLLDRPQPARRRGLTLIALASAGAMQRDNTKTVTHGFAALDHARNTASGVLVRQLTNLRPRLIPLRRDRYVKHLDSQIAALARR